MELLIAKSRRIYVYWYHLRVTFRNILRIVFLPILNPEVKILLFIELWVWRQMDLIYILFLAPGVPVMLDTLEGIASILEVVLLRAWDRGFHSALALRALTHVVVLPCFWPRRPQGESWLLLKRTEQPKKKNELAAAWHLAVAGRQVERSADIDEQDEQWCNVLEWSSVQETRISHRLFSSRPRNAWSPSLPQSCGGLRSFLFEKAIKWLQQVESDASGVSGVVHWAFMLIFVAVLWFGDRSVCQDYFQCWLQDVQEYF